MKFSIHRHLDIGCGDGYFLKRSKARERYGFDTLLGDKPSTLRQFEDNFFNCISLLAVIEHFDDTSILFEQFHRLLSPKGRMIITTPKKIAENIIRLYVPDIDDEHETYFTRDSLIELLGPKFRLAGYHTFELGLNQVFCLEKIEQSNIK
ncbi:class I SAM-dependent methyltransferase [Thermodesulfobacteriota bacterium]